MGFFDRFKLVRTKKQDKVSVKYGTKTLAVVYLGTLAQLVTDTCTERFRKMIIESEAGVEFDERQDKVTRIAMRLAKVYTASKRKWYKNKKVLPINSNGFEFTHFKKAARIILTHKVTEKEFMEAQIKGLEFVNDGVGTFPKPSMLATVGAEDRLLSHMPQKDDDGVIIKKKEKEIFLTKYDYETPLMENPRFVEHYEKLTEGTADLPAANYLKKCMIARKGRASKKIEEYIEKLKAKQQ